METIKINDNLTDVSVIGLGTWAIGGWLWGGTDEKESIKTIRRAFEKGINLIDTAPVYGFGRAEEICGLALQELPRHQIYIATKLGLEWLENEKVFRNSTPRRLRKELNESLRRLKTDYIDIYQIHWPDPFVAIEDVAETMMHFYNEGKIRAIGVSNFTTEQMEVFQSICPLHTNQPPYNIFERDMDKEILPYCKRKGIVTLAYGALCRGLLTGRMKQDTQFVADDLRKIDPKFKEPRYTDYLRAVDNLDQYAKIRFNKSVLHLAVRWVIDKGQTIALWGARRPEQLEPIEQILGWHLTTEDYVNIYKIVQDSIIDQIGPEFMAPPPRDSIHYQGTDPL